VLWIYFGFCALSFGIYTNAYALNLDKAKIYFMNGDYKSAILEGEKILAKAGDDAYNLEELYYTLSLSYLKDGNYLRASDIFEIIIKEFKDGKFKEEAILGLGDTYFLRGDFSRAESRYKELLNIRSRSELCAAVYYRLSQIGFKTGDIQKGKEYLDKLKQNFPLNLETKSDKDICPIPDFSSGFYYTVQVGAFANAANAANLTKELIEKGYPAYIEEPDIQGRKSYRVRIGKLRSLQETIDLEKKLTQQGYPTKICP
jgi:tetratricopeptide (TPR) repeat protein